MTALPAPRALLTSVAILCAGLGFSAGCLLAQTAPPTPAATAPAKDPKAKGHETKTPAAPAKSKAQIEEETTLDFLKAYEPDVYKWALVLKEKDPKRYNERIKDLHREVRGLLALKDSNLQWFEVKMQDRRLAFRALQLSTDIRNESLTPEAREKAREELPRVVAQQFDVRQKLRQFELDEQARRVEDLKKKLDKLKADLDNREKHKDDLITQRVNDLLKRNPNVDW